MRVCVCVVCASFALLLHLRLLFGIVWPTYLCTLPSLHIPPHSPTLVLLLLLDFCFLCFAFEFTFRLSLFILRTFSEPETNFISSLVYLFFLFWDTFFLITCTECNCIIVFLLWAMFMWQYIEQFWFICPPFSVMCPLFHIC